MIRRRTRGLLLREFGIADVSVLLAAASVVSTGLGAVRQILLFARFGAGPEVAAYYAAARLPEILFALVSGGALWTAMIPVLAASRLAGGDVSARRLADAILTAVIVAAAVIAIIGEIAAGYLVPRVIVRGFDAETTQLTVHLTRLLLLQPLLLGVASVAIATLNERNRFLLPALALAGHNVVEIAGLGLTWMVPAIGIWGPAIGVVEGAVLQVAVLFGALWRHEWRPRPRWSPGIPRCARSPGCSFPPRCRWASVRSQVPPIRPLLRGHRRGEPCRRSSTPRSSWICAPL